MGQCLGKPKNVKTYDSYQLEQARTVSKRRNEEESVEERRRKFAEAAEKRRDSVYIILIITFLMYTN